MDGTTPLELGQLLHAPDSVVRDAAWDKLIARHTRLMLSIARSFGGDEDETMERYSYLLEKLRADDFHRLRAFQSQGSARFSTWLTVSARRLCLDYHRARYGRSRAVRDSAVSSSLRGVRRRLTDSLAVELDMDLLPDPTTLADATVSDHAERDARLRAAVGALSPRDRLLLALRFEDGLSASRIARVLDVPTPFHVYRRLNMLLGELRSILESHGIDGVDG